MSHLIATWLLPIFFALVGNELRAEIKGGAFTSKRKLLLPLTAAIFGVLIPFLIYELFVITANVSNSGWGVVVATDLPLALFALKFFNREVAEKLRPYLLSVAIFDDLVSILLIALLFHKNGVHPTVYGFLLGILIPVGNSGKFIDLANKISNYLIIPLFILSTVIENWSIKIGLLTFAVIISRMFGKPLGIFLGDLLGRLLTKTEVLNKKEVLAVGATCALGLSVSFLFAEISDAPGIAYASVLVAIPIALVRIKVLSKTFMKGNF